MFFEVCVGALVIIKLGELILKTIDTVILASQVEDEDPPLSEEIRTRMYS